MCHDVKRREEGREEERGRDGGESRGFEERGMRGLWKNRGTLNSPRSRTSLRDVELDNSEFDGKRGRTNIRDLEFNDSRFG